MAREERSTISVPSALVEELGRECPSVSAYARAVLEGANWELARARARVAEARLSPEEIAELGARVDRERLLPLADACAIVLRHEEMGRRAP